MKFEKFNEINSAELAKEIKREIKREKKLKAIFKKYPLPDYPFKSKSNFSSLSDMGIQ